MNKLKKSGMNIRDIILAIAVFVSLSVSLMTSLASL